MLRTEQQRAAVSSAGGLALQVCSVTAIICRPASTLDPEARRRWMSGRRAGSSGHHIADGLPSCTNAGRTIPRQRALALAKCPILG